VFSHVKNLLNRKIWVIKLTFTRLPWKPICLVSLLMMYIRIYVIHSQIWYSASMYLKEILSLISLIYRSRPVLFRIVKIGNLIEFTQQLICSSEYMFKRPVKIVTSGLKIAIFCKTRMNWTHRAEAYLSVRQYICFKQETVGRILKKRYVRSDYSCRIISYFMKIDIIVYNIMKEQIEQLIRLRISRCI
jgi:hypothetical protein